jgi:hypothetical protein
MPLKDDYQVGTGLRLIRGRQNKDKTPMSFKMEIKIARTNEN